jgi:hypothetical protein
VNWLLSRVTLRIRTLSETLDLGFVFCAENRKAYGKLSLAALSLPFAICVAAQAMGAPWWQIWALAVVLGAVSEGAFTAGAGQLLFASASDLRALLTPVQRRIVPYLATRLLSALVLLVGTVLILPLPAMTARTLYVSEYCLLEAASPTECLRRGARLMKGQAPQALALALWLLIARVAFVLIGDALGQAVVEFVLQLGRPVGSLFQDGGSTYALAGFFLSLPYVATARFLGYIDSRTRREGWDIQVRFAALLQRATTEEAAA